MQNFTTIFKICISSNNNLSLLLHSSEIWHFYRQNRGGSKLTRGSSQVNLTLIETETRVQAYFDTPFLNFKIFLKVHIKFLHKPIFWHLNIYINIARMGKTKDLSKDCKNIVLNLFKFFQLEKARGRPFYSPDNLIKITCKAAGISYSSVYRVANGKSPPESNKPKERKLLMILTVARW